MTKATNYLATVTDVNSEFPAKGAAVPNSNRCVIKDQTGQTVGSLGATNNWYVDESASPFVTYTNARLPRWQDLVPLTTTTTTTIPGPTTTTTTTILNCNFTFSTVQVPSSPVLDSTTGITIFFDSSGSMAEVLPSLYYMRDYLLKPCLLPYYNNDSDLYDERVQILEYNNERAIEWLGAFPIGGSTKTVNLTFCNEVEPTYTNTSNTNSSVSPWVFLPNSPVTLYYTQDINFTNSSLSANVRAVAYRVIFSNANANSVTKGFYNAVFSGTGNYSGANGLSTNSYAYFIDDVAALGLPGTPTATAAQYYTNKVIEGMNLLGYNLSPC